MDDLQLKVSSPDRYIVRRNGDLDLDPTVRRIRDLTMFGSLHEREQLLKQKRLNFLTWLRFRKSFLAHLSNIDTSLIFRKPVILFYFS